MKMIVLAFVLIGASADASVRATWGIDGSHVVLTMPTAGLGDNNSDELLLWDLMNVSPQDSFVGPGKVIETANKDFSLVCGQRQQRTHCTIAVKKGPRSMIDVRGRRLKVAVTGEEGQILAGKFHLENGSLQYGTGDGKMTIRAGSEGFLLQFQD